MSLPYFPMFPSDFEAKTSHLTMAEDGAYNRLLRICWMTPGCSIPADETWIMRRVRALSDDDKQAVRSVLTEFFTVQNGRYSNAKLMRVWNDANEAHKKRKNAGSKGGAAKSLKNNKTAPSNATAKPKQPEPELEPYTVMSPNGDNARAKPAKSNDEFTQFWSVYPHKVGKRDAEKAFAKARTRDDFDAIMSGLRRYAAKTDDRPWCNPATFLNQDRWTDQPSTPVPRQAQPPPIREDGFTKALREDMERSRAQRHEPTTINGNGYDDTGDAGPNQPGARIIELAASSFRRE